MPQRVSDADVKEVLDTDLDTQPFIRAAHLVVEQHLSSAGLSDDLLREIECYLAAHFACARDPLVVESRADTISRRVQRASGGAGLDSTDYGRIVQQLDPTGKLDQATKVTKRAWIRVD